MGVKKGKKIQIIPKTGNQDITLPIIMNRLR